jgi:hypothetical protein
MLTPLRAFPELQPARGLATLRLPRERSSTVKLIQSEICHKIDTAPYPGLAMSIHPESLLIWCPNNGRQRVAELIVRSTSHLAASMVT